MWEVYEVKGVLGFGVLLRYRGLSWEPLEAQILQYTSKFFTIKKTAYSLLFIKHLPPHLLPIRLLAFGHFYTCFSTCSYLLLCVLHMCLLTLSYIHKHTNEFHRLHERHIAYVSINTIIYNGKRSIYKCVQCVLCVIYAHGYVLVYMDGGRVVG